MKWSDLTLTLKIGIPFLIILGLLMAVSSVKGWFASLYDFGSVCDAP